MQGDQRAQAVSDNNVVTLTSLLRQLQSGVDLGECLLPLTGAVTLDGQHQLIRAVAQTRRELVTCRICLNARKSTEFSVLNSRLTQMGNIRQAPTVQNQESA